MFLTLQNEIAKEFVEFDGLNRVSKIYVATSDSIDGDRCLVKEFIYYGISTVVRGRIEGYGFWSSSFDAIPDFLTDDLSNLLTDDTGNILMEF